MKTEIEKFLERHHACSEGRGYAMTQPNLEAVWNNCPNPSWLIWILQKTNKVPNDQTLPRFAIWRVREIWHLLKDERSRNAIEIAERFLDGNATVQEVSAAAYAAAYAAYAAADAAAYAAAYAAYAAADAAAYAAAYAAYAAADAEEQMKQANHLKLLIPNPFKP
jgi:hypothetical protein